MVKVYLDTSAAMKLLVEEAESEALAADLAGLRAEDALVSSWLLHTELHCAARRRESDIDVAHVQAVLDVLLLVDLTRADLLAAPAVAAGLRSQDALHLAVALRAGVDRLVTYDAEQAAAAERAGLAVRSPA